MQNVLSLLKRREADTGLAHVVIDTPRGNGLGYDSSCSNPADCKVFGVLPMSVSRGRERYEFRPGS